MSARQAIQVAATELFELAGVEKTTVAAICRRAGVSNGSFFHAFATKEALAGDLFLSILGDYHDEIGAALAIMDSAETGIFSVIDAHLSWVTRERGQAKFLFQQVQAEWLTSISGERISENERFAGMIDGWRQPLIAAGGLHKLPLPIFVAQLLGPVQIFCRAWLAGRRQTDPRIHRDDLAACAIRALVCSA